MSKSNSTNPHRFEYVPEIDVCYCKLDFMGLGDYLVGDDGEVWTKRKSRNHKGTPTMNHRGWRWFRLVGELLGGTRRRVILARSGRSFRILVHRLVLTAFRGPCPPGMEGCHDPDYTPSNNNLGNLRWDTCKANMQDRSRHGHTYKPHGELNWSTKLSEGEVKAIRRRYQRGVHGGMGLTRLGKIYNVDHTIISDIVNRKTWKHI